MISRNEALNLLRTHISDEKIIKHCIAVEAIMKTLARKLGEDEELWDLIGLLHDLDYELTKRDMKQHGLKTIEILNGKLPRVALEAIALHNEQNGFESTIDEAKKISHALRASDHLSGLIIATALVMPNKKLYEVSTQSLVKKFKAKDFARNINRDRIREIEMLGIRLEEFFEISLEALREISSQLGL